MTIDSDDGTENPTTHSGPEQSIASDNKGVLFSHSSLDLLPSFLRTNLTNHEQDVRKYKLVIKFYECNPLHVIINKY